MNYKQLIVTDVTGKEHYFTITEQELMNWCGHYAKDANYVFQNGNMGINPRHVITYRVADSLPIPVEDLTIGLAHTMKVTATTKLNHGTGSSVTTGYKAVPEKKLTVTNEPTSLVKQTTELTSNIKADEKINFPTSEPTPGFNTVGGSDEIREKLSSISFEEKGLSSTKTEKRGNVPVLEHNTEHIGGKVIIPATSSTGTDPKIDFSLTIPKTNGDHMFAFIVNPVPVMIRYRCDCGGIGDNHKNRLFASTTCNKCKRSLLTDLEQGPINVIEGVELWEATNTRPLPKNYYYIHPRDTSS